MIHIAIQLDNLVLPVDRAQIRRWAKSAMSQAGARNAALSFVFLAPDQAQAVNRQYRKKNYATNVLTFNLADPQCDPVADIVICPNVVKREAKEQKKTYKAHLAHMVVHGTLHALGFDHENKADAAQMEALEITILKRFDIKSPYSS
jgi:probable rRNA maturation factor